MIHSRDLSSDPASFTEDLSAKLRFMKYAAQHKDYTELGFITHHLVMELSKYESNEVDRQADELIYSINSESDSIFHEVMKFISFVLRFLGISAKDSELNAQQH